MVFRKYKIGTKYEHYLKHHLDNNAIINMCDSRLHSK
jgi:hypothetical protein